MSSALPLKTPTKSNETTSILPSSDTTPTNSKAGPEKLLSASKTSKGLNPKEISSPHELTAFVRCSWLPMAPSYIPAQVENLLEQLDTKFDEMSTQVLDRSALVVTLRLGHLFISNSVANVCSRRFIGSIHTGYHKRRHNGATITWDEEKR